MPKQRPTRGGAMERIEADIYDRLSKVIDPELGRTITK